MSIWHGKVKHIFIGVASKEINPGDFLEEYRGLVDELVNCRNRLKNPVNLKNGQPLAQSTILGFETRIDSIKSEIRHYRVVLKLLRLFGYFGGNRGELSIEQRVIKCLLDGYVFKAEMANRYLAEHQTNGSWKKQVEFWKERVEVWKQLHNSADKRADFWERQALGEDGEEGPKLQETECRVYPFSVVDGGQKFEDDPPFAPVTPS